MSEEKAYPDWYLRGDRVDEVAFAQEFLISRALKSWRGSFYGIQGKILDEQQLRQEIYRLIKPYICTSLNKKVNSLLEAIRLACQVDNIPVQETVIHLENGYYHITDGFVPEFQICRHRLPVCYNEDCGWPKLWMEFLGQLLEEEDIDTLQEYMGYCLLPTTIGQKMLIITGSGGEGKSRIGVVMKAIFGNALGVGSLNKVEMSPFARADLEDLLVFVDDDLKMEGLTQTNYLKSIITAETDMDLERKGRQSYQGTLYTRFLAFGNSSLQAIHDRSHGFFRRQIILTTKPRPGDRVDDPYLAKKLIQEKEQIFMWALSGLVRLFAMDFQFTISPRARMNLEAAISRTDNVRQFLQSQGYLVMDPQVSATSKALYECYCQWCSDNNVFTLPAKVFSESLANLAPAYQLQYSNSIPTGAGRYARGYRGIRIRSA